MVRATESQSLELSLLDKLTDSGSNTRMGRLSQLRQSVRRDLENLLNAKVRWHIWPARFEQLDQSLLNYGLPDFSSLAAGSAEGREQLCRWVRDAIRRFEPRFMSVQVALIDDDDPATRVMRLRIHALLGVEPTPERLVFESEVEPLHLGVKVMDVRS